MGARFAGFERNGRPIRRISEKWAPDSPDFGEVGARFAGFRQSWRPIRRISAKWAPDSPDFGEVGARFAGFRRSVRPIRRISAKWARISEKWAQFQLIECPIHQFSMPVLVLIPSATSSHAYLPLCEGSYLNLRFHEMETYQLNPMKYREVVIKMKKNLQRSGHYHGFCLSGDYIHIKVAGVLKMIDLEKQMMLFLDLLSYFSANIIFTYFARQVAAVLSGER
ncbi:hypothetical protein KSP39_PZI018180 [Platanthera zijinensis]|uniref:Uncharacterized protein n=1 Tax=Platanthera zijinensis TaxID=2320716 RepID=A0AAP0B308_9ASPA